MTVNPMFCLRCSVLGSIVVLLSEFPLAFASRNDTERNPCFPNPCHNDGQCAVSGANFECSCASGWKGEKCEGTCNRFEILLVGKLWGRKRKPQASEQKMQTCNCYG